MYLYLILRSIHRHVRIVLGLYNRFRLWFYKRYCLWRYRLRCRQCRALLNQRRQVGEVQELVDVRHMCVL